ncbi:HpcH/HpaI aldolase family protein [Rhodococcus indonesiensis]
MRANNLRSIIADGRCAVNAWLSTDSPYTAEALSHCGFDSVTVDAQHGMFGRDALVRMLQAIAAGPATPMARPSTLDPAELGWLLDAGAYGIVAPGIDTAEAAEHLVAACTYPPRGRRSFGPSRGLLYGGPDYLDQADCTVTLWAMIESAQALGNLEQIAAVPGLYGLYIGPNDLALDLGERPGGRIGDTVARHCATIRDVAHRNGLAVGVFCADGDEAARWRFEGFDLVTPGNDLSMIRTEAQKRIASVRGVVGAAAPATGSGY